MKKDLISLDDKYMLESGSAFMSGTQALVRIPIVQRWRDQAAGLNTAGFISGYRGSPLGGYDQAIMKAKKILDANDVHFQPGLNEELAATAVWGTQQVNIFKGANYDGVFGIWYGKGPGVDRTGDTFRHANAAGTSPHGGVLAIAGDDHSAKSSTLPHQSDHSFYATMLPMLYPTDIQEFVEYGLLGIAMSRYSGCWTAFKVTSETAETTATVDLSREQREILFPDATEFEMPPGGVHIRPNDVWKEQDYRLQRYKLFAALAFVKKNKVDQIVMDSSKPRFGIITSGKSYGDVRQALFELGIDQDVAEQIGLRVYKVGMPWPLEPDGVRNFCTGLEEILIVEEKRELIENQLKQQLFNMPADIRPRVVGKYDEKGQWLLPPENGLSVGLITHVIADRISRFYRNEHIEERLEFFNRREDMQKNYATPLARTPYFCSGCPHNTSTKVPEGSRAAAGIGCHIMALWMDRNTSTFTQMGGEGVPWVGQAPFTKEKHIFANLGDGTYFHSGVLAVRQSIAAGVNITYKILYNDAVAMTGGQPHDGQLTVPGIASQMAGEGAKKIWILTEDLSRYDDRSGIPAHIPVLHRDELPAIQEEARNTEGCTVIIYDQTCAAEKRRRRKRGLFPDPDRRVFINDAVCEGCGDCSVKSNCVSVEPLETEYGRKRTINQSSCNKDYSCVNGFCPSFVSVYGGKLRKTRATGFEALLEHIPEPAVPELEHAYNIMVSGVGGTGVLTIGALLGMAAHVEGKASSILDMAGLAQKGGAVLSHVRLGPDMNELRTPHILTGGAHLLLACDMVVAASPQAVEAIQKNKTRAVINAHRIPVSSFVEHNNIDFKEEALKKAIAEHTKDDGRYFIEATEIATHLLGDSIATNIFMLGYAWQKGLIPLGYESLKRAIELNGVAVEQNLKTFACGRLAAHAPEQVEEVVRPLLDPSSHEHIADTLDEVIEKRENYLTAYQNAAYARKYTDLVNRVRARESELFGRVGDLSEAVARFYHKLMAYKDEYEVARLYSNGKFLKKLEAQFEGDYKLQFHLAPPILEKKDKATGLPKKREFGPWMLKAFGVLAKFKGLRGTALDIFGYTEERRQERQLIREYQLVVEEIMKRLNKDNYQLCVDIASFPKDIRGYGHVKERNLHEQKEKLAGLLSDLETGAVSSAAKTEEKIPA
ncbi:indolepyruvate ferredoxin oxidoreductase family protein [Emcibacter nanhaiensis]|nr:indolepyruvate ferredoxin oxidoreductase family protein [Emcibacter nanhaiensis]